jgi:long-chain fatty acid transport protein
MRRRPVAAALSAALLCFGADRAVGAGFALQEQNASGLGNAYASGAAAADDVSTIYFNPAGLVRIRSTQVAGSADLICLSAKFHDDGNSQPAAFQPLGGTGGDAGDCSVVPDLYFGIPFADRWSFGIAVNVPFGLKTEYDSDWLGRFQAVKSKVDTININPALSWQATPQLSLGAGVSWQRLKATLTSKVNYAGAFAQGVAGLVAAGQIPAAAAPVLIGSAAGLESEGDVSGNDTGWGWNLGAQWQANDQARFGIAYRSKIKFNVSGSVNFSNPTTASLGPLPPNLAPVGALLVNGVNAQLASGDINLHIELPDTANGSVFYRLNNQWDLMGDVQYTGWSTIKDLTIVRSTGQVVLSTPENFRDTWRVAAGANYHYGDQWTFRGGVAYDQSPVRDAERTPRLPDSDRTWLTVGVQYKPSPSLAFDLGYAYIWIRDPSINQNEGSTATNGLITGSYRANVNIVGLQVTYTAK